jgi:ribulose-5-phosphate 4-epimerase/fuculose-1-phosphate aldolase
VTNPSTSAKPAQFMSEIERQARYELAVVSRVSDQMGMSDTCGGFAAARIAGEDAFVMRGHNQHPALVTIGNLHRVGLDQELERAKNLDVDAGLGGMCQAIFKARADVNSILHGHTPATMIFTAIETELLPISQFGVMYHDMVDMIGFDGVDDDSWCRLLVEKLGGNPAVFFSNHGIVTVGQDCKQAMHHLYAIEQAVRIQIGAMQTGARIRVVPAADAKHHQARYWGGAETEDYDGSREWASWVQIAERCEPSLLG